VPAWLPGLRQLDASGLQQFLASRTVFYPGAGHDGDAFRLFGGTHSACYFVHADYDVTTNGMQAELQPDNPGHLRGYRPIFCQILNWPELEKLLQVDLDCPVRNRDMNGDLPWSDALFSVLEREPELGADHGPTHHGFLHVCADAHWTFWHLWGRRWHPPPFAIVLQDHGFGGNWAGRFGGQDSCLYWLANENSALPQWLLVGEDTDPWPDYTAVSACDTPAGQHGHRRRLFRRQTT
jgi:hypothetical protein